MHISIDTGELSCDHGSGINVLIFLSELIVSSLFSIRKWHWSLGRH